MDDLALLIDMHAGNARLAPGDEKDTLRAAALAGLRGGGTLEIADMGCGTGASALVLARELGASVTAIDAAPPFIERLNERASAAGLADRVRGAVATMESPGFAGGSFDVVWSEGAIYNVGFEAGARAWREYLKPGGVLAVTELTWRTAQRPADVEAHWKSEYPAISTPSENMARLEDAGYAPIGMFFLPSASWEANYYAPLRAAYEPFLERHGRSDAAQAIVDAHEAEAQLYREQGQWYGYAFFIARKVERAG